MKADIATQKVDPVCNTIANDPRNLYLTICNVFDFLHYKICILVKFKHGLLTYKHIFYLVENDVGQSELFKYYYFTMGLSPLLHFKIHNSLQIKRP